MRTASLFLCTASLALACGGTASTSAADASASGGDGSAPDAAGGTIAVGAACPPAEERSPKFAGFNEQEVSVETKSAACSSGICLVNHFRGRTTCPYGQDSSGKAPSGASPCAVPGGATAVTPQVPPQCTDRRAADTVHCSCRCANADGKTDDGATYCTCPQGLTCTQLVMPFGPSDPLAGAYCTHDKAAFDRGVACQATCDPQSAPCP